MYNDVQMAVKATWNYWKWTLQDTQDTLGKLIFYFFFKFYFYYFPLNCHGFSLVNGFVWFIGLQDLWANSGLMYKSSSSLSYETTLNVGLMTYSDMALLPFFYLLYMPSRIILGEEKHFTVLNANRFLLFHCLLRS